MPKFVFSFSENCSFFLILGYHFNLILIQCSYLLWNQLLDLFAKLIMTKLIYFFFIYLFVLKNLIFLNLQKLDLFMIYLLYFYLKIHNYYFFLIFILIYSSYFIVKFEYLYLKYFCLRNLIFFEFYIKKNWRCQFFKIFYLYSLVLLYYFLGNSNFKNLSYLLEY